MSLIPTAEQDAPRQAGLAGPEAHGGAGAGFAEVAIGLEEAGDALVAVVTPADGFPMTAVEGGDGPEPTGRVPWVIDGLDADHLVVAVTGASGTGLYPVAAERLGGAAGSLDLALEYVKERRRFGRPIGSFQAVEHHCADLYVRRVRADQMLFGDPVHHREQLAVRAGF